MTMSCPQRFVATLTTIPSRLSSINPLLRSILNQEDPFDRVYLHVPEVYGKTNQPYNFDSKSFTEQLAKDLQTLDHKSSSFVANVLENVLCLNECGADYGPITKLVPVLDHEQDPETMIVVLDDDRIINQPTMLREIKKVATQRPEGSAIGMGGFIVGNFPVRYQRVENMSTFTQVDFLQGVNVMVLQRSHLRKRDLLNEDNNVLELPAEIYAKMRTNDDHQISACLARSGVDMFVMPLNVNDFVSANNAGLSCVDALSGTDLSGHLDCFKTNHLIASHFQRVGLYRSPDCLSVVSVEGCFWLILTFLLIFLWWYFSPTGQHVTIGQ